MNKAVIYIDVDDDITSIIDKLKSSKEKIVAFVPPKGSTVLQSAVNLKLLKKAAESASKQPVIVTNNHALTSLAGGIGFYIAKNLQSRPTLINGEPEDLSEDESIDLSEEGVAPIVAASTPVADEDEMEISADDIDSQLGDDAAAAAGSATVAGADSKKAKTAKDKKAKSGKKDKKSKVPNFNSFRKKALIGLLILLILIPILVFLIFKPKSSVALRAETTPVDVAFDLNVDSNIAQSNPSAYSIKANKKDVNKTLTTTFKATEEVDKGEKATGTVSLQNCSRSDSSVTISRGTGVSANGLTYLTDKSVVLPASTFSGTNKCRTSSISVGVTAQENGDQYNSGAQSYNVAGESGVNAYGSKMSGGSSKIVKVVSQSDVNTATKSLTDRPDNEVIDELKKSFGDDTIILTDSFTKDLSKTSSDPAVGAEADEATLSIEASYSMLAVSKSDLISASEAFIRTKMTDKKNQRVYDSGIDNYKLTKVNVSTNQGTYKFASRGQYGPEFDVESLKDAIASKKIGEARTYLQDLPGVKGVDIDLSPFWARNLPKDKQKIEIRLEVDENSSA